MIYIRTVDTDSDDYSTGVRAANLMLDTGMDASEVLELAETAMDNAHHREDARGYNRMAGVSHTLREFLETRD